jgi:hypothetical protein
MFFIPRHICCPSAVNNPRLNCITAPVKSEFTAADAYVFTRELEQLHPDNKNVRPKIRQQLQVLRNAGLLLHVVRLRHASVFVPHCGTTPRQVAETRARLLASAVI